MSVLMEDGSPYNASTLVTYYNGIARFFVDEKKLNIWKDPEFVRLSKVLSRRQEESVKAGKIPGITASNPILVWRKGYSHGHNCSEPPAGCLYQWGCYHPWSCSHTTIWRENDQTWWGVQEGWHGLPSSPCRDARGRKVWRVRSVCRVYRVGRMQDLLGSKRRTWWNKGRLITIY